MCVTVYKPFSEINYYLVKQTIPSALNRQYQAKLNENYMPVLRSYVGFKERVAS